MKKYVVIRITPRGDYLLSYDLEVQDWLFKSVQYYNNHIQYEYGQVQQKPWFANKIEIDKWIKKWYPDIDNYYLMTKEQYEILCTD